MNYFCYYIYFFSFCTKAYHSWWKNKVAFICLQFPLLLQFLTISFSKDFNFCFFSIWYHSKYIVFHRQKNELVNLVRVFSIILLLNLFPQKVWYWFPLIWELEENCCERFCSRLLMLVELFWIPPLIHFFCCCW